ncbi:MAG: RidA family protein [Sediminibacterium sp.]|nr:RidA family protein [Sediminibacterium sp.]
MEVHHQHHSKKSSKYITKFLILFAFLFLTIYSQAQSPEENLKALGIILKALGIILPKQSAPIANYVTYVRTGNLIYFSGSGPSVEGQGYIKGKLGKDMTIEQGKEAARITGINLIANLKNAVGDLNKVKRIVKVLGMVNSTEDFTDQPKVMNGFSDLMVAVFGEKGKHARSAVGMAALPMNMAVEIEMIVEVEN